ncbi:hypothetical protein ACFOON_01750 [Novosphingobium piscinae]|uniref:Uncharacterized protein n=1 Tax=Novosphingobium piscinae TaxID=1507448 RepID=A0A7X1KNQ8_9SPHN|nr:hypothetical protein [Novosphingobium piscinae]MBC2667693.1 hypothetical protein [Novosphingobium piscinae]
MTERPTIEDAAARVISLEAELETAGHATTGGDELAATRAALHAWVETVVAAVASPGVGRVTLIHANGTQSKIAAPDLPFLLTRPVSFDQQG